MRTLLSIELILTSIPTYEMFRLPSRLFSYLENHKIYCPSVQGMKCVLCFSFRPILVELCSTVALKRCRTWNEAIVTGNQTCLGSTFFPPEPAANKKCQKNQINNFICYVWKDRNGEANKRCYEHAKKYSLYLAENKLGLNYKDQSTKCGSETCLKRNLGISCKI
jgi:hypothetical protein